MKITFKNSACYLAPQVEVVEVALEAGFAQTTNPNPNGYADDIEPWVEETW
ncbi:hypothetical protein FACS1894159_05270 [Bacteroidia bacterium]|nr:hypothetical protein FACS1894159_05270 [Bacteroidia bacterium]